MQLTELGNNFFLVSAKAPADLTNRNQTKNTARKIINYGHKNLYAQDLIGAVENSPTATACVETHSKFLYGDGFIFTTPTGEETDFSRRLRKIFNDEMFQNTCYDFSFLETFSWRYKFNLLGQITDVCHQDVSTVRLGIPDEEGNILYVMLCSDWENVNSKENKSVEVDLYNEITVKQKLLTFTEDDLPDVEGFRKWAGAVDYVRRYKPGQTYYTKPKLASALKWMYADGKFQNFHSNNVDNAFTPSVLVYLPYSIEGKDENGNSKQEIFKQNFQAKLGGSDNTGPAIITGPNKEGAPQIIPYSANNNHELYIAISELTRKHICTATQVPPELAGIETPGKLGGTQEIINKAELYQSTVIKHDQNKIVTRANYIISKMAGFDGTKASISNNLPIRYIPEQVLKYLDPAVVLKYYGFDPIKDLVKGVVNV